MSAHKYSDAAPVLLEYTHRQPKDAQGLYALALAYQGLNQTDAAVNALQRASVLDPKDPAIRFQLGMLLTNTGKTDAAI
jgi:cytochrome c-type biogenesis protein CcmH/NrfG